MIANDTDYSSRDYIGGAIWVSGKTRGIELFIEAAPNYQLAVVDDSARSMVAAVVPESGLSTTEEFFENVTAMASHYRLRFMDSAMFWIHDADQPVLYRIVNEDDNTLAVDKFAWDASNTASDREDSMFTLFGSENWITDWPADILVVPEEFDENNETVMLMGTDGSSAQYLVSYARLENLLTSWSAQIPGIRKGAHDENNESAVHFFLEYSHLFREIGEANADCWEHIGTQSYSDGSAY